MKKSTIGKLAAFAMVLLCVLVCTMKLTATAGAIPAANVNVDYVNETITVTTDSDKVVYYTETYNKDISRWDACEVREKTDENGNTVKTAVFDISWVNENKTVRLYLCGDVNTDVISVDITWEEDFGVEFTGTLLNTDITEAETWKEVYEKYPNFSEDTGYLIFTLEENGRDMSYFPNESLDTIQWRKGDDGVWREFSELDLKEMNIRGIKLEFRIVANDAARASSTAGISISKLTSAPAVVVNPDTMTVGLKNGMEFSFDKENWIMIPSYNKKFGTEDYLVEESVREAAIEEIYTNQRITSVLMQALLKTRVSSFTMNTPMSKDNLTTDYADKFTFTDEGIVLYVRDAATNRKAASKIAEVIIPYAAENMAIANAGDLKFSYGESKTNTGGIVVENTTEYKYQVGVITPEDTQFEQIASNPQDIDLSNMKWTSIKGGKTLKIANKKVPKGSYLVYRIAGEDGNLPSTYQIYGPMEYNELTYAGTVVGKKAAGETIEAVVSTNFEKNANGTYDGLTFQWQRCANPKAADEEWENIKDATAPAYELTNDDSQKYVRVVVTNKVSVSGIEKEIVMTTDPEGPIAYVVPKEESGEETNGDATVTPAPEVTQ